MVNETQKSTNGNNVTKGISTTNSTATGIMGAEFGPLMDLCLEKTFQVIAVVIAMLFTTTISYFAGPMVVVMYMVMLAIPLTFMISLFPDVMCIRIQGISLTSKSSDISWILLYWGYWMLVNYTFFLVKFDLTFTLWCIIPMDLFLFLLAIMSRITDYLKIFTFVNILILFFPMDSVGIFREDCIITIVRVALYFLSFYVIEFATKTSGMTLLPYTCWILNVWKWFLILLVVQFIYVFVTDYFKRNLSSSSTTPSCITNSTCVTTTNKIVSPTVVRSPPGTTTSNSDRIPSANRKNNTSSKSTTLSSKKNTIPKPKNNKSKHKHKRKDDEEDDVDSNDEEDIRSPHQHTEHYDSITHPSYNWNEVDHFGQDVYDNNI